jgi:hypothetical protein
MNNTTPSKDGPLSVLKKAKRVALSWDQDFKPRIQDLSDAVQKITGDSPSNKSLFMICLGIGFTENVKRDVPPRKSDAVRLEFLKSEDVAVLKSVALAQTRDFEVLLDEDAVYDIVESFAAGGLEFLAKELDSQVNFQSWLSRRFHSNLKLFAESKN